MEKSKSVSTPLATHFKFNVKQSHSNEVEKTYMSINNYTSMVALLKKLIFLANFVLIFFVGNTYKFCYENFLQEIAANFF